MRTKTRTLTSSPSPGLGALLLLLLSLGSGPRLLPDGFETCPADGTRVAVAALDTDARARISPVGGRAPYFLLFEAGEGMVDVVVNEFIAHEKAAGTRAVYLLTEHGVDCLVAGEAGERVRSVLAAEGIGFVVADGRAAEVAAGVLAP